MSKSRDIADSAATINYIDNVTSDVQSQINTLDTALDNISVTSGTLTKTFTTGESSTINLSSSVLAPVVSVTKEVPQTGVTNNSWDVNSTTENYTRLDSAYDTTLDWAGFSIANASFVNSFSVTSQDTSPTGIAFNTDGTKMFVVGDTVDDVNEYALSTGFDVSTASFVSSFSVAAQETAPRDIAFNNNGTKMFITGPIGDDVNEYTLSTGFDISTASFVDRFSVASQETAPTGLGFNPDGTKMYVVGAAAQNINEYTLSTGFDVSTASFVDSFSLSAQDTGPRSFSFNTDGTKMFVVGSGGQDINEYALSTGFDISTASFVNNFSVSAQDTNPWGIAFNTDGTKMFVVGLTGDAVYEYSTISSSLSLGTGSFASADVGKTIEANSGEFVLTATDGSYVETTAPTSYDQVASGDWSMYGVVYNAADGDLQLSGGLFNAFDVSAASFVDSFSLSAQVSTPFGVAFNTDGTKMFITDFTGADVNEYALTTGFDVSTASYTTNFSVSGQDSQPAGIAFNTDGTRMFIVGHAGDDVNQYTLSTGFSISTAAYSKNFSVASQDSLPFGVAFNNDGTKMFIVGINGVDVNEYTLSIGFDVATASFVDSFSVASQEISPAGITFNTNGTKMFIVGYDGDAVYEYALTTGFDVSTAAFVGSFSVAAQDTIPRGIAFNNYGNKMFITGQTGIDINEYDVGSFYSPTGYQPVHTTASIDSTYWTDINSMTADQAAGDGNVYYAISTDDRTTWTVIDNTDGERDIVRNNGGTWQYNSNGTYASETWTNGTTNTELATLAEAMSATIETGYVINSATYDSKLLSVSSQMAVPRGMFLKPDGTKVYVVANTSTGSNTVFQYSLSTAYDIATASYDSVSFSVSSQSTNTFDVYFKDDGTKMYVLNFDNDSVYQYTLSTAWDVSSASYDSVSFSVGSQEAAPYSITFNASGTLFYAAGNGNIIYQYTLSTAWDMSSASYASKSYNVGGLADGISFNNNGTKLFSLGSETIRQHSLTSAYDVSTASYDSISLSLSSFDGSGSDIFFGNNGTKLYYLGYASDSIKQFSSSELQEIAANKMDKTQLDAVTDPNHIALGNDLDLAIIFNMTSGTTVPSSDGVAINYDANVLNKGAVLGTDYDFDAPAQDKVRITALAGNNLKVRVV